MSTALEINILRHHNGSAIRRIAELHREWMDCIQPVLRAKTSFMSVAVPSMLLNSDGTFGEVKYNWPPEVQERLAECDKLLAYIRAKYEEEARQVWGIETSHMTNA